MRVLLISHTCQSRTEGQPKAEFLGRIDGIDLCVLVPQRWKHYGQWREPEVPAAPSFRFRVGKVSMPWVGPAQFYLHWYPGLSSLLRDFGPDVIDLWEEPWGLVSAQACRLRDRILPAAKVVSETEQNLSRKLPPPFERFRSYTLRRADFLVGRSREAVEVARGKGYRGPAEVVPNAVDAELFRPLVPEARERGRMELGFGPNGPEGQNGTGAPFLVGYVGRLVDRKGLTDLVSALPRCPPEVHVVMIGSGPLRDELDSQAKRTGVGDRLHFVPARPLEQLPLIMNALDALAIPSWTVPTWKEQFGRVIIEANACAVPVIGSDSGAIPDVIGAAGVVVPERNPEALAGAICDLAADRHNAAKLGQKGRQQVEDHYTWARVAQQMARIYERVVRTPRAGAEASGARMRPGG